MNGKKYIPVSDSKFDEWFDNFVTKLPAIAQTVGLSASQVQAVQDAYNEWDTDYDNHISKKASAHAARAKKENTLATAESVIRSVVNQLQPNPQMTDEFRMELNITVRDIQPTPQSPDYVLSVNAALLFIDFSDRQQLTLHFGIQPENERENAKPDGIAGGRIWFRLIEPHGMQNHNVSKFLDELGYTDWREWHFLADDTHSPYVHVIETSVPITLEYKVQWFDRHMRPCPSNCNTLTGMQN